MLVLKLQGGIGNQLFQFWSARKLSRDLEKPLRVDTSFFRRKKGTLERTYQLEEIVSELHDCEELSRFATTLNDALNYIGYRKIINESTSGLIPRIENSASFTLDGYWQNYRNFDSIKFEITEKMMKISSAGFLKNKLSANLMAVHVRRGDYASNYKVRNHHGLLTANYFEMAEEKALEAHLIDKIVVFSEDIEWCKKNLNFRSNCEYFQQEVHVSDLEVLLYMSRFRNFIISHSSFSWWAAYIGHDENSFVCMPGKWNVKNNFDVESLRLPGWQLVEDKLVEY